VDIKDRILEASEELFLKYGFKSITMDEIARHLAISKKTIYQYYQDKDEIVYLVTKRRLDHDQESLCQVFAESANAIDEALATTRYVRQTRSNIHLSLLFDLQKYHPNAWKIILHHKRHFILTQITNNLVRGVKEGLYRPEIRIDILARLRLEQIEVAFNAEAFPPDQFHFIDVQEQLLEHFMRGIVTEKGLQLLNEYYQQADNHLLR
jgi:TetR/AcrR family transcriptional regulator, cholesterol catabolism regulator